jgi:hypothetical protein
MSDQFPPWVILHVPHDSTLVPPELRHQITLGDDELAQELIKMTDHLTLPLFASGVPGPSVRFVRKPATSTNSYSGRGLRGDTVHVLHQLGIGRDG